MRPAQRHQAAMPAVVAAPQSNEPRAEPQKRQPERAADSNREDDLQLLEQLLGAAEKPEPPTFKADDMFLTDTDEDESEPEPEPEPVGSEPKKKPRRKVGRPEGRKPAEGRQEAERRVGAPSSARPRAADASPPLALVPSPAAPVAPRSPAKKRFQVGDRVLAKLDSQGWHAGTISKHDYLEEHFAAPVPYQILLDSACRHDKHYIYAPDDSDDVVRAIPEDVTVFPEDPPEEVKHCNDAAKQCPLHHECADGIMCPLYHFCGKQGRMKTRMRRRLERGPKHSEPALPGSTHADLSLAELLEFVEGEPEPKKAKKRGGRKKRKQRNRSSKCARSGDEPAIEQPDERPDEPNPNCLCPLLVCPVCPDDGNKDQNDPDTNSEDINSEGEERNQDGPTVAAADTTTGDNNPEEERNEADEFGLPCAGEPELRGTQPEPGVRIPSPEPEPGAAQVIDPEPGAGAGAPDTSTADETQGLLSELQNDISELAKLPEVVELEKKLIGFSSALQARRKARDAEINSLEARLAKLRQEQAADDELRRQWPRISGAVAPASDSPAEDGQFCCALHEFDGAKCTVNGGGECGGGECECDCHAIAAAGRETIIAKLKEGVDLSSVFRPELFEEDVDAEQEKALGDFERRLLIRKDVLSPVC